MITDDEINALADFRVDQMTAHMERRRELAREFLQKTIDDTPRLMAELQKMRRDRNHVWRIMLESVARRRTVALEAQIEAQIAEASEACAAASRRATEAESQLRLAMTWGAALASREPAPVATFQPKTGGEPWTAQPAVYFVLNEGTGQVKIGRHDGDMDQRLRRMRTDCGGSPLRVLAMVGGEGDAAKIERRWHLRFKHKRALGEYFRLSPEDIPETDFDVSTWARAEADLGGRLCTVCGETFAATRRTQTICGSTTCRSRLRAQPNAPRLMAWKRPAAFTVDVPQSLAMKFAERGRSLTSAARDLLLVRVGVSPPPHRGNARGPGTVAKRPVVSLVLPEEAWPKIIEATIEGGHRTPHEWAEAVFREAAA